MKKHNLINLILVFVFLANSVYSQNEENSLSKKSEFERSIDSIVQEYNVPGLAIALIQNDSVIMTKCVGFSNIEKQIPITPETQFRMASISKSFVALAILKLVEDGKLSLETPLKEIIPEIEIVNSYDEPVRVVHLLEHTAGFDHGRFKEAVNFDSDPYMPLKQVLEISPGTRVVRWKPGTRVAYSNHGYAVAGYVIEKISGQKYETYIEENILKPSGMNYSSFILTETVKKRLATGYVENNQELPYYYGFLRPCGSMHSSLEEMSLFVRLLLNKGEINGNRIITENSIQRMRTPESSTFAKSGFTKYGYGKGIVANFIGDYEFFGHSGGIPEFTSQYMYNTINNTGLVFLMNCGVNGSFRAIRNLAIEYLINEEQVEEQKSIILSAKQLEKFTGFYQLRNVDEIMSELINMMLNTVTISVKNDTLYYDDYALIPVSSNVFKFEDSKFGSVVFTEEEGNMIIGIPDRRNEFERTSAFFAYLRIVFVIVSIVSIILFLIYILIDSIAFIIIKIRKKEIYTGFRYIKLFTFLSIISILIGVFALQNQMGNPSSGLKIGYATPQTVTFFISTLLFALFSLLSLVFSIKGLQVKKRAIQKIFLFSVSVIIFAFVLFLSSWELIGLRTWAY